jgi:hypothetical protein
MSKKINMVKYNQKNLLPKRHNLLKLLCSIFRKTERIKMEKITKLIFRPVSQALAGLGAII